MSTAAPGWLGDERRALAAERILDAAGTLFAARGVGSVDMRSIAAAAGCSRATLYRYFENRDALHLAFVHRATTAVAATVARAVAGVGDPRRRLVTATVTAVRAVRADPFLAVWFTDAGSGLAGSLAARSSAIEDLAAAFLGDPDDPDVRRRARWLVRCIVSLLAVPAGSAREERALVERFVAPVVLP